MWQLIFINLGHFVMVLGTKLCQKVFFRHLVHRLIWMIISIIKIKKVKNMWNQSTLFKNPYTCYRPVQRFDRNSYRQEMVSILPVNISESPDAYHFDFYAPGFTREEITIREEKGILHVNTKPTENKVQEGVLRTEFLKKEMVRSVKLPRDARRDEVMARLEDGVLRITVRKDENLNKTVNIL